MSCKFARVCNMRALFIWQLQLPLTVPAAVTVSDSLSYSLSLSVRPGKLSKPSYGYG